VILVLLEWFLRRLIFLKLQEMKMFEEIGLSNINPTFLTTLMPKDGTYEKINWIKPRHLVAHPHSKLYSILAQNLKLQDSILVM
jgi:hypothetical protein